ncbi:MAG: hypothetical protein AAF481_14930 [Acidobacteriota bacterium]
MQSVAKNPPDRPTYSEMEIVGATRLALEEGRSFTGPHPELEEWEDFYTDRVSAARRQELEAHLETCDQCLAEYRDLSSFLAPFSPFKRLEPAFRAVLLLFVAGTALWAGMQRISVPAAPEPLSQTADLWLQPVATTRSGQGAQRLPELVIDDGREHYDLELKRLENEIRGLFRIVVLQNDQGSWARRWTSPGLPVDAGDQPVDHESKLWVRLPARIFDTEGTYRIELRELSGGVVGVFLLDVVESAR